MKTIAEQLEEIERDANECIGNDHWAKTIQALIAALKKAIGQRDFEIRLRAGIAENGLVPRDYNKELQAILAGEK